MRFKLEAYNIYELGARERQEDSIFPPQGESKPTDRLFVLCDGMGGHEAGDVASRSVCEAISSSILNHCPDVEGEFHRADVERAVSEALDALDRLDSSSERKMGTTLTLLKLHSEGATIAHIGDSRVYHIRPAADPESTQILFQTEDHSLVNDLVKIGELTKEQAKSFNRKNVITRAMQPGLERRPKADIYQTSDIRPGDYFLLCSDGILEQMEDDNLKYIFSQRGGDALNKVDMLVKVTQENRDNHSAHIIHILDVEPKSTVEPLEASIEEPTNEQSANNEATPTTTPPTQQPTSSIQPAKPKGGATRGGATGTPQRQLYRLAALFVTLLLLSVAAYYLYAKLAKESNPRPKGKIERVESNKREREVQQEVPHKGDAEKPSEPSSDKSKE